MDTVSKEVRSRNMAAIKGKNTKPEIAVRKILHSSGYRYRLHRKELPGKPDIVLPKYKTVIFVHGCFWHNHKGCKRSNLPKSNQDYWLPKIKRNAKRDNLNQRKLKVLGWRVIIVWECEVKNVEKLCRRFKNALSH